VACNLFYLMLAIWIIFGIKTDVWSTGFLFAGVSTLFVFAVLLTVALAAIGALLVAMAVASPLLGRTDQAFQYIQEFTGFFTPGVIVIFVLP